MIAQKLSPEQLDALEKIQMRAGLCSREENDDQQKKQYYFNETGSLFRWKRNNEGALFPVKLANFEAVISEEVSEDDGVDVTHHYTIKGKSGNRIFPPVEIPASQFGGMNWLYKWGTDAIIEPGSTNKDYVRHAIQVLSNGKTKKRFCYAHTGWRNIAGQWSYLSNAGAIGLEDVNVKLSRELERYNLPSIVDTDETEAINTSLSFLEIGKHEVTLPLFAVTYLAPLTTLLNPMPNFSSYIYGQSGTFKSTISLLQLGHFGTFSSIAGLNNFDDSANSIEKRAFTLKDTLLVLDDYHPSHRRQDAQAKESLAQRLIRSFSNRTARGRLNADTTDKGRYEPRGMLQITGEELVSLQSTLARILVTEVEPGDIDKDKLTLIQQQAHLLPQAMTSFLAWIRENITDIQSGFPSRFMELRNECTKDGVHRKVPEQTAFLFYAMELVSNWLQSKGIHSEDQGQTFLSEAWNVLITLGEKQSRRIEEDDPVRRFADILNALITSGNAKLEHIIFPDRPMGAGELIGYHDDEYLYLLTTSTWHSLNRYCLQEGSHFPFSKNSIYKMLRAKNLLISSPSGTSTSVVKIHGNNERVIKIYATYLKKSVTSVTED